MPKKQKSRMGDPCGFAGEQELFGCFRRSGCRCCRSCRCRCCCGGFRCGSGAMGRCGSLRRIMASRLTRHINLVAAFHDDKQGEKRKSDKSNENFPHDMSPRISVEKRRMFGFFLKSTGAFLHLPCNCSPRLALQAGELQVVMQREAGAARTAGCHRACNSQLRSAYRYAAAG